ncbi:MAG: peptidase T [Paludibacteraceae bacterium]|nr:peptidase T [Paludibacteraceae bacterium]
MDRFIRYTAFETTSSETSGTHPSSPGPWELARHLQAELASIGLADIHLSEHCYLYARLPGNCSQPMPVIGFIAHLDTSPEVSGKNVKARIVEVDGEQRICSDGTTLLGADDKAGVAAIVTACEQLVQHPETEHGDILVAFTPDEEIGEGTLFFERDRFPADWAYTVDGGELGELSFENFNAASTVFELFGTNCHPGYAKGKMKNALLIASQLMQNLSDEIPENTEDRKGFYHLHRMDGTVSHARLNYLIREFDEEEFDKKKRFVRFLANSINTQFGEGTCQLQLRDQYHNMRRVMEQHPQAVRLAQEAMRSIGVTPNIQPIRGGTDGAMLSEQGLPCPNLFTGGANFHSLDEYIPVAALQKSVENLLAIATHAASYPIG